jgi:hypothetical protein
MGGIALGILRRCCNPIGRVRASHGQERTVANTLLSKLGGPILSYWYWRAGGNMQPLKRLVAGTPLERPLRLLYRHVSGKGDPSSDREARAEFDRFCRREGASALRHNLLPGTPAKKALIVNHTHVPVAKVETFLIKALQAAGFDTVTLDNGQEELRRYHRLAGATSVAWSDFGTDTDTTWVDQQLEQLSSLHDCLALNYNGVHVGRFATATVMRTLRMGQLDFGDPSIRAELRKCLVESVKFARAGNRILAEINPDCVVSVDRGYIGQGELFDLALDRKIDTLAWNVGFKSNLLYFKRHNLANERDHHASISADSWARMLAVPWTEEYGRCVRDELLRCYQTQDWFNFVGTQFGKTIVSKEDARARLGLVPDKKVAVIFPHILWDGSFFWGDDLFENYARWLAETIRAACANPRLQWVVKVHPSHVVKSRRDSVQGRPQELDIIEGTVGTLPDHVKLLHPEDSISTYSVYQLADYAITVRGTSGIEASVFGVPVVTAGTGRYAGRGFTIDPATPEEYLEKLRTLDMQPPMTPHQIELAERYAFGIFFGRPLQLSSVALEFVQDATASWKIAVHCKTREDWLNAPDIRRFAKWIGTNDEDMFSLPT